MKVKATNRLWRAIAACFRDRDTISEVMVWAKVMTDDKGGKRHAYTEIELTKEEHNAVQQLFWSFGDHYLHFCLRHERQQNPEIPWTN